MSRPARALLGRSGVLTALVVAAVELPLFAWFASRAQLGSWLTHLLVGAVVALLVMTLVTRRRHRLVPNPAVGVVAGHLLAAVPDVLVAGGVRPGRWMDVFLGNLSAHYTPAGNLTWLALAATATVTYVRTAQAVTAHLSGAGSERRPSPGG